MQPSVGLSFGATSRALAASVAFLYPQPTLKCSPAFPRYLGSPVPLLWYRMTLSLTMCVHTCVCVCDATGSAVHACHF